VTPHALPITGCGSHTAAMSQVVGERRTYWVVAAASVMVVGGATAVLLTRDGAVPEKVPASSEQVAVMTACTQAAQDQLQPRVTLTSGEAQFTRNGVEWTVTTAVNHKTKWDDHWYDVTCVVAMPGAGVVSVETAAR
jgi:hypothetical protein